MRFNEHSPLCLPPLPFLPPLFDSKSTELLTGSEKILVCTTFNGDAIILKVGEQGISSRAETANNFLTATVLKVHLSGSL